MALSITLPIKDVELRGSIALIVSAASVWSALTEKYELLSTICMFLLLFIIQVQCKTTFWDDDIRVLGDGDAPRPFPDVCRRYPLQICK